MFLDPDGQRPLLYSKLRAQFQELQTRPGRHRTAAFCSLNQI